jgi:hypothetical protein
MSEKREAFVNRVEIVVELFEAVLATQDWLTRRDPKRMRDEVGQIDSVLSLRLWFIHSPFPITLDAIARSHRMASFVNDARIDP